MNMRNFKMSYLDELSLAMQDVLIVPYGSHVYETNSPESDYDLMVIVPDGIPETEKKIDNYDFHSITNSQFQKELDEHQIKALEVYFYEEKVRNRFGFKLDLQKLRESISHKASHSFVKAKKKIEKEHDTYVGIKSLFHSLRILMFGIQIAKYGKIEDYSEANFHWADLKNESGQEWSYFKTKYQPIYNSLATEFRLLAPKE